MPRTTSTTPTPATNVKVGDRVVWESGTRPLEVIVVAPSQAGAGSVLIHVDRGRGNSSAQMFAADATLEAVS